MKNDLKQAAERACNLCGITPHSDMRIFAVHAAMVAIEEERQRCATIAREFGDNGPNGEDEGHWTRGDEIALLIEGE